MKRGWIRLPSPAMGVALIALVVAMGGSSYAALRIGTKQIKNNAVTSDKIRNGAVKNIDLARNSVVTAKIVASAVTGLQIKDASVGNADLGNDSVTGGEGARRRRSATATSPPTPSRAASCARAPSATAISPTAPSAAARSPDGSLTRGRHQGRRGRRGQRAHARHRRRRCPTAPARPRS